MNLLATVCLMLLAACTASALRCKDCWYAEVKKGRGSGDADVEEFLDSLTSDINEECKKQGEDYTNEKAETCPAGVDYCAMRRFNTKLIMNSVECELEWFSRGCVFENQTVSAGCHKEGPLYEDFFRNYAGVSSAELSGDACYCNSDLCNAVSAVLISPFAVILAAVLAIRAAAVAN